MKLFAVVVTLFISSLAYADAWDNLTYEEAEAVVRYVEQNPYVFDYCDCCQSDDDEDDIYLVKLMKVTDAEIVPCSWNTEMYSVEYNADPIAELVYKEDGSGMEVRQPERVILRDFDPVPVIYMNYTWGFNSKSKMAKPLFESIDYHYVAQYGGRSCKKPFSYPTPKDLKTLGKFKDYKKWYKRAKPSKEKP